MLSDVAARVFKTYGVPIRTAYHPVRTRIAT
jgi:hypothetical protein